MDITSQSNFKTAYKIAIVAKPIYASDETINAASLAATKASANKNATELAAYASKNGLKIIELNSNGVPVTLKENDYMVGNMQDARSVVKWVFDAKKGDVSDRYRLEMILSLPP